jgi:tetratricopeptide (TPR) repeat protein
MLLLSGGLALVLGIAAGCHHDEDKYQEDLDSDKVALAGHRYELAVAKADALIAQKPTAEAYYLRGRAEEDRAKIDQQITEADFSKARKDYQKALELQPTPQLTALLHNQLANIAYFENDYQTALSEWGRCYDQLDTPDAQAHALYRMGICQQRMSNFDEADHTFISVQQRFPQSAFAAGAAQHQGVRQFSLQLGVYENPADAAKAAKAAQDAGQTVQQTADRGTTIVRVGPFDSFFQANTVKARLSNACPDSIVLP